MKKFYLVMMAVFILVGACQIKNPVLPKWDVELNVPLINDRFYASDLADSSHFVVDSTNVLVLTANGNAESDEFGPVPFTPSADMENIPIPGTGRELFIPFIDDNGEVEPAYAEMHAGFIRTRFTNVNSGVQQLKLVFHNIFTAYGEEFEINYTGNTGWVTTDLSGMILGNETSDQLITELPVSLVVSPTLPEGTTAAQFSMQANSMLQFAKFRGQLNDYSLALESGLGGIDISYPYGIDQAVHLQEASLRVYLKNYIGFAARFSGRIKATNEAGETRYIDVLDDNGNYYYAPAANGPTPGEITIDFHNNVSYLLQIMPTHLEMVEGVLTISSGQGIGDVEMTDKLYADYLINAPMSFVFYQHEIIVREEQEISIPENNRERIRKNAQWANIQIQVQNQLPIGASARVYFSTIPTTISEDGIIGFNGFSEEMTLQSSETNPGWQNINLSIDAEEIQIFTAPTVYMRWAFTFEASDGPVTIYAGSTDYVHVKGMMTARIRVED
jgi:hypothetical protein